MSRRSPKLTSLHDRPSFLLSQLGFHSDSRFDELIETAGLTRREFGMLRVLADADGQTQQQLGARLGIHRNVMVGLVDQLEQRGLVERTRNPADRRAHAIVLTAAGRRVLPAGEELLDAVDADLVGMLSSEESGLLVALLQRMTEVAGRAPSVHPGMTG